MRILYDHQVFSLQNRGGISRYHFELALHLSRCSHVSINVFLGFNRCPYPFRSLERYGARILGWDANMSAGLARYALNEAVTSAYSLATKKWDIYHPTYYRGMPWVRSRRIVATNHDCTQERFPELFANSRHLFPGKRKLYDNADAIICVSESSRKDLLKYYDVAPEKTHVIYLGVTRLERNAEEAREFIARIRRPYILYVGTRSPNKNFEGLLEAYGSGAFAKDYDLVVIGGCEFTNTELDEIRRLGISDNVLHWGIASEPVLAEAYSRAQLFVFPSLYEGFGLPPLEAMSLGCPVLASNTSAIPEVCGDAALYFDPTRPGDLERSLRDALNDPGRLQHIAMGLERAAGYDWKVSAEKTLEVYEAL